MTDTLDGDDGAIQGGDLGGERPNDQRGPNGFASKGDRVAERAVVRRALRPGFALSLLIARHEGGGGAQGAGAARA